MSYDSTFNIIGSSIGAPTEEALAEGADPVVEIAFTTGMALPFAGPDGQPVQVPAGLHRYRFSREQAFEFAKAIQEGAEKLPKENKAANLLIASNLSAVEQAAEQMRQVSGR